MNKKIVAVVAAITALGLTACTREPEPTVAASVPASIVAPATIDPVTEINAAWDSKLTLAINTAKASMQYTGSSDDMVIDLPSSGRGYEDDPIHVSVNKNGEQIAVYDYGEKAPVRFVAFYTAKDQVRKTTYTENQIRDDLREQSTSYCDSLEMAMSRHREAQQLFAKLTS